MRSSKQFHEKALPLILRAAEEIDLWLDAPFMEALSRQRPLPDDVLKILRSGEQQDEGSMTRTAPADIVFANE